jgi:hypothetical protein
MAITKAGSISVKNHIARHYAGPGTIRSHKNIRVLGVHRLLSALKSFRRAEAAVGPKEEFGADKKGMNAEHANDVRPCFDPDCPWSSTG